MRILESTELESISGGGSFLDCLTAIGVTGAGIACIEAGIAGLGEAVVGTVVLFGVTVSTPVLAIGVGVFCVVAGGVALYGYMTNS